VPGASLSSWGERPIWPQASRRGGKVSHSSKDKAICRVCCLQPWHRALADGRTQERIERLDTAGRAPRSPHLAIRDKSNLVLGPCCSNLAILSRPDIARRVHLEGRSRTRPLLRAGSAEASPNSMTALFRGHPGVS